MEQDDHEYSPENSEDSPYSGMFNDTKTTSTLSPKRSRRSSQKRVVSVPLKEVEGSRLKGETNAPPSDSWAWRKYGQKPIKGSPYPRGYYRCSSSKGCPARKQVERSRADPTMVIVTYSCDHNHSWPAASRNNHHQHNSVTSLPLGATSPTHDATSQPHGATSSPPTATIDVAVSNTDDQIQSEAEREENFKSFEVGPCGAFMTTNDQFGWFSDLASTSSTMLESPLMVGDMVGDADMAMIFSIREEDEYLFADLGELPECTTVFRRKELKTEEEHHRMPCNLAS